MKKIAIALLSLTAVACTAVAMGKPTTYEAAAEETHVAFTETKYKVSTDGRKMLLVTGISNYSLVYEVGYEIAGYTVGEDDVANTNKYYDTVTTGGVAEGAADIFGAGYEDYKLVVWEVAYTENASFKVYALEGEMNGEALVLPETEKKYTGEVKANTKYEVTFENFDGTELQKTTFFNGQTPEYTGEAPEKQANETYAYEFAGWDKTLAPVSEATTYTATFTPVYVNYSVKFVNDDGTVISEKTDYHYGDTVVAPTEDPTKAPTNTVVYTFNGWDKIVGTVAEDVVYTATYTESTRKYSITFVDENGNQATQELEYGETPVYEGTIPSGYFDTYCNYTYGFDKEIVNVAADATYTVVKTKTYKEGYAANGKVTTNDSEIVLGAGQIGDNAHYSGSNYLANPSTIGTVSQAYFAFDGNFGFNKYVVFDFTGKNMPNVAFFAHNYDDSMYYGEGDKYGLVVTTGLTTYNGQDYLETNDSKDVYGGKGLIVCGPQMLNNTLNSGKNGVLGYQAKSADNENVALGRTNLVATKNYRVIMGFEAGNNAASVKVVYALYSLTDNQVVDIFWAETYNFFETGWVKEGQTRDQFCNGSIVLYGHFGTTCTVSNAKVETTCATLSDALSKNCGFTFNNTTVNKGTVELGKGEIGIGANYNQGNNSAGHVRQAYYALDGNYGLDDYVSFEFTGKNMPEIAFFAKNYDDSMYYVDGSKQGVVVVSGITDWQGNIAPILENGTQVNFDSARMIIDATSGSFVRGGLRNSQIARANLVDGKNYRVVMGFSAEGASAIRLKWCLYDVDASTVVENVDTIYSWNFFTGTNADQKVNNMKLSDLVGSIVLYGKFGTTCTVKNVRVYEDTTIAGILG